MRKNPKWAKLELEMVYSEAYNKLNAPTLRMLSYVILQLKWENTARSKARKNNWIITNKDEILLQYSTFQNRPFKMGIRTITMSLDSLLAHGFISVSKQGGKAKGHRSIYSYSEKWFDWKEGDEPIEIRKPYAKRGFQEK